MTDQEKFQSLFTEMHVPFASHERQYVNYQGKRKLTANAIVIFATAFLFSQEGEYLGIESDDDGTFIEKK